MAKRKRKDRKVIPISPEIQQAMDDAENYDPVIKEKYGIKQTWKSMKVDPETLDDDIAEEFKQNKRFEYNWYYLLGMGILALSTCITITITYLILR